MDLLLAFRVMILAIIQGVAEFLPISSSGHLLVLGRLFQLPDVFLLTILLHLGTLMSVIVFFYRDICDVFAYNRRVIWLVIVGSIPTVAIAFSVMKYFPHIESSRAVTGVCFLVTGFLLLTLMRNHSRTETEEYYEKIAYEEEGYEPPVTKTSENTSTWDAFIIGIAQGIAVLPGLSRSGTGSTADPWSALPFPRWFSASGNMSPIRLRRFPISIRPRLRTGTTRITWRRTSVSLRSGRMS